MLYIPLKVVMHSDPTFEAVQSRQAMENVFRLQLTEITGKMEDLVSEEHTALYLAL